MTGDTGKPLNISNPLSGHTSPRMERGMLYPKPLG